MLNCVISARPNYLHHLIYNELSTKNGVLDMVPTMVYDQCNRIIFYFDKVLGALNATVDTGLFNLDMGTYIVGIISPKTKVTKSQETKYVLTL